MSLPDAKEPLLHEISVPGRRAYRLPPMDVPIAEAVSDLLPGVALRQEAPQLPECSELQVVRHFTRLSRLNFAIDTGFYPLGSCTMKYNPKVDDEIANLPGLRDVHPYAPADCVQGALAVLWQLERALCTLAGMDAFSLQPAAGAHGELAGMFICAAYHKSRGEPHRTRVVVPDSAHGTNPASAAMAGFDVVEVPSDHRGNVDLHQLRSVCDERLAAVMLTNPNTLGLWEEQMEEVSRAVHGCGGLLYYDGANANAIVGRVRPGDMGFDICHLNLHKTFSTPHGMGGPGAGPVGVARHLTPFLPSPRVQRVDSPGEATARYVLTSTPESIGRVRAFYGNFAVLVRALAYIRTHGGDGLAEVSGHAVLAANYLLALLREDLPPAIDRQPMHEFVADGTALARHGSLRAIDLCKALLDRGFHAPTMYFPLIVKEALMIEPTETEPREVLEAFAAAVREIVVTSTGADAPGSFPTETPIRRMDEVNAARHPVLRWNTTT